MKKAGSLLLALVLALSLTLSVSAEEAVFEGGVTEIQKYGNIVLDIDPAKTPELLEGACQTARQLAAAL